MPKSRKPRSWAEQLAELEDPTPIDFDPEDNSEASDSTDRENEGAAVGDVRGHYIVVGKSKLRKVNTVELGPQYIGSTITRDALDYEHDHLHGSQVSGEIEQVGSPRSLSETAGEGDRSNESGEAYESPEEDSLQTSSKKTKARTKILKGGLDTVSTIPLANGTDREDTERSDDFDALGSRSSVDEDEQQNSASEDTEMAEDDDEVKQSWNEGSSINSAPSSPKDERATLREMMAEEYKTVAATLSQAAKGDIDKGRAVKRQRGTFDALLNTRIKLQKALVSTNSLSVPATSDTVTAHTQMVESAETAALNLWTLLNDLRTSLHKPETHKKRLFVASTSTFLSDIWTETQSHESTCLLQRRSILTNWSQKMNPAMALSRQNKFSRAATQQPLTSVLDQQLSGPSMDRLVARTRVPRSCAPLQAGARIRSDNSIYDDADFYSLLLRELVDQRMADTTISSAKNVNHATNANITMPTIPSQRDLKIKKQVDTKASKGRKMRYTVHEKLQNFMAPDDRGSWGERQREELFASLLGSRLGLIGRSDGEEATEGGEFIDEAVGGREGLRLFG
ncbi:MAG: hypothetical protein Q9163_002532 [Psora crenata]